MLSARANFSFFFDGVSLPGPSPKAYPQEPAPPSRRYGGGSNGCSTQATAYLRDTPPTRRENSAAPVAESGPSRTAPPSRPFRRRINVTKNIGVLTSQCGKQHTASILPAPLPAPSGVSSLSLLPGPSSHPARRSLSLNTPCGPFPPTCPFHLPVWQRHFDTPCRHARPAWAPIELGQRGLVAVAMSRPPALSQHFSPLQRQALRMPTFPHEHHPIYATAPASVQYAALRPIPRFPSIPFLTRSTPTRTSRPNQPHIPPRPLRLGGAIPSGRALVLRTEPRSESRPSGLPSLSRAPKPPNFAIPLSQSPIVPSPTLAAGLSSTPAA